MYDLTLISQSPRRKDLLAKAGYNFKVDHIKVSEIIDKNLNIDQAVVAVARQKLDAYLDANKPLITQKNLILTADTAVVLGDKALGKPQNFEQAFEFLSMLSGNMHRVKTGLCVYAIDTCQLICDIETTEVFFKTLNSEQIQSYIETGEPMDKAGGYGIQGQGKDLVKDFRGSWSNVVGLPLEKLEKILDDNNWQVNKR